MDDAGTSGLEAALLARVAGGDQPAFEVLFRRFERPLYAYFVRVSQDPPLAEELVCDTMAAVWRGARTFRGEARASTWIFGIAHRVLATALRRRRPQTSLGDVEALPAQNGPEEHAERTDVAARVRQAIASLPPEHREVVELTFDHGFSYPQIARILGIPLNTVKTRMFYARQKLKPALVKAGIADGV